MIIDDDWGSLGTVFGCRIGVLFMPINADLVKRGADNKDTEIELEELNSHVFT